MLFILTRTLRIEHIDDIHIVINDIKSYLINIVTMNLF